MVYGLLHEAVPSGTRLLMESTNEETTAWFRRIEEEARIRATKSGLLGEELDAEVNRALVLSSQGAKWVRILSKSGWSVEKVVPHADAVKDKSPDERFYWYEVHFVS